MIRARVVTDTCQHQSREYPEGRISQEWLWALATLVITLLCVVIAYSDTFVETAAVWSQSSHFKIGRFVVPLTLILLWYNRQQFLSSPPRACGWGIPLAALSAAAWLLGEWTNISLLRQLALLGVLISLVLSVLGPSLFLRALPYLAMLLFALPVWELFLPALKSVAILLVKGYAFIVQLPLESEGYSLYVDGKRYIVIDYCAGLQFILLGLLAGWTFGLLIYRSLSRIFLLSLLGGALALLANALRIAGIITYDYVVGGSSQLDHAWFEMPALIPCFALLFFVFYKLQPENTAQELAVMAGRQATAPGPAGLLGVGITVVVLIAGPLLAAYSRGHGTVATDAVSLPMDVGGWQKTAGQPLWQPVVITGQVAEDAAIYRQGDREILVYRVIPLTQASKISGGAVQLFRPGYPYNYSEVHDLCNDGVCRGTYVRATYMAQRGRQLGQLYYAYQMNDRFTASVLVFRLWRGYRRLVGETGQQVSLIVIASDSGHEITPGELARLFTTTGRGAGP